MAKRDNKVWIALGISVALLGAIIAVNQLYGWNNVLEDVQSMGKSVWFAFSDWVDVKIGDQDVVMPEEYVENEEIVERGTNVTLIDRFVNLTDRVLERVANISTDAVKAVRNVNTTALQEDLSNAIGATVEFVNVTLSTGRELLLPVENATRRALGESFNGFIAGVRQEFENFTSSENLQYMLNMVIELPQSIIQSIRNMLTQFTGMFSTPIARTSEQLPAYDAMTYGGMI